MNIFPRLAHCNTGCTDLKSTASSKMMRVVQSLVCPPQTGAASVAEPGAARPTTDLPRLLRSMAGVLSLLILAALLVAALFTDNYGRAVQVQASGYSALSDKIAGSMAPGSLHDVADTTQNTITQSRTGL